MKKCDTCIYRNENEYHKPCIVYRDDCEYYEKERGDMTDDLISREAVLKAIDVKAWEFCDYLISEGRNDEQKPVSHFADNLRECVRETEAMTKSNSEEDIYKGCLRLMGSLTCKFFDWLNYIGVDVRNLSEEEQFCVKYDPKEIVEMLFLFETPYKNCPPVEKMKCEELDIDANKSVSFDFSDELESEMLD